MKTPDELKALYEEGAGALDMEDLTPLFEELDRLRDKYDTLQKAAEPFIRHSARLVSQSTDGKAILAIEVTLEEILDLRKVLKGK